MPKTLKIQIFLHPNIKIKINCRFNTYSMYLHTGGQRCKLLWAMKCSQDSLYHVRVARKYANLGKNSMFSKEKSPLVFPLLPPLWKKTTAIWPGTPKICNQPSCDEGEDWPPILPSLGTQGLGRGLSLPREERGHSWDLPSSLLQQHFQHAPLLLTQVSQRQARPLSYLSKAPKDWRH